jgi:hypothetical protein
MAAKNPMVLSNKFERVGETGLDERKRVSLSKALDALKGVLVKKIGENKVSDVRFIIYTNEAGQILLSPRVSIPLHEAWLYKNPEALASVRRGLKQLAGGKRYNLGSFAKYADDEID